MRDWNCKAIISTGPDLIITSDTSKLGSGRALGTQKIQDQWTGEEKNLHINVLEIFAEKCSHTFENVQSDSSSLYPEDWGGGYQQCSDYANNPGDLAVLPGLGNFPFSRIPVWQLEQRGRLAEQEL